MSMSIINHIIKLDDRKEVFATKISSKQIYICVLEKGFYVVCILTLNMKYIQVI